MKYEDASQLLVDFAVKAKQQGGIVILGLDPGITGAMALTLLKTSGKTMAAAVVDIPSTTIKKSSGKGRSEYDLAGITGLLKPLLVCNYREKIEMHACIEKTHPNIGMAQRQKAMFAGKGGGRMFAGDTPLTAFSMGWSCGMWPLFLQSWNVRLSLPSPSTWKAAMKLNKQDKEASRQLAARQFPQLAAKYLSAKSHHNRAEALLLTTYYRRFVLNAKRI